MSRRQRAEIQRLSENLTTRIQAGEIASHALDAVREELEARCVVTIRSIAIVVNQAVRRLCEAKSLDKARDLIAALDAGAWNNGTNKLHEALNGEGVSDANIGTIPNDADAPFRRGWQMIREGQIREGVDLVKTAIGVDRGKFVTVANFLLEEGHLDEALDVIEPVLALGIGRCPSGGLDMGAINVLARCARRDNRFERRFIDEVERLRTSGALPVEYCKRAYYLLNTGRVFAPSKCRRAARKHGAKDHRKIQASTRQQIAGIPLAGAETVGGIPELEQTGAAKRHFEHLINGGHIAQAMFFLLQYKGRVQGQVYRLYEKRVSSALATGAHGIDVYEEVITLNPVNDSFLILAIQNLLQSNTFDDIVGLFWRHGRDNLRAARALGQLLFETGRRQNSFVPRAADALLRAGKPKTALEIIKPTLLNYISSSACMPLGVMKIFAQCAAVDTEIRQEFLEQLSDYRRQGLLAQRQLDEILHLAFVGDGHALVSARQAVTQGGIDEPSEEYRGRVSRSRFFQDPHAMLRADPLDITAARVSGKSWRSKKRRHR